MKTSDKIALLYFVVCVAHAGFFAILGYALSGTRAPISESIEYFCYNMIWLLTPGATIFLLIDTIKYFRAYKLLTLIVMLLLIYVGHNNILELL